MKLKVSKATFKEMAKNARIRHLAEGTQTPVEDPALESPAVPTQELSNVAIPMPAAHPIDTTPSPREQGLMEESGLISQGKEAVFSGLKEQRQAVERGARAELNVLNDAQQKIKSFQDEVGKKYADFESQHNKLVEAANSQQINPNQYFDNLSTGGKVLTAIGLLIGGAPAGQFLKEQIDRDIDAQVRNMDRKKNLVAAHLQQFGNLKDAIAMTKANLYGIIENDLKKAAIKTNGQQAKAKLIEEAGKYAIEKAQLIGQVAEQQALFKRTKDQQGQPSPVDLADQIRATVPKEMQKDALDNLATVTNANSVIDKVRQKFNEAKKIGGIEGNLPFSQKGARMDAIRAEIISDIRSTMKGQGQISDQEQASMIEPLLPKAINTRAQVEEKMRSMEAIIRGKANKSAEELKQMRINPGLNQAGPRRNPNK